MTTKCFTREGAHDVTLEQTATDSFIVTYGLRVRRNLGYADAAKELGICIMHQLACEGLFDDYEG